MGLVPVADRKVFVVGTEVDRMVPAEADRTVADRKVPAVGTEADRTVGTVADRTYRMEHIFGALAQSLP